MIQEENHLFNFIQDLPESPKLTVADIGCGNGSFLQRLITYNCFEKIYGFDYSSNMLEMAKEKCQGHEKKVVIKKRNLLDMREFENVFDIVFSINSILPREPKDTDPMLREIQRILKPGGKFVAVLPSFDTVEHLRRLELGRFTERRVEEVPHSLFYWDWMRQIRARVLAFYDVYNLFYRERKMNVRKRLYADDGVNIQRFIHEREIQPRLQKWGFNLIERGRKLYYGWDLTEKFGYGCFPRKEKIWDWFVIAEKPR